MVRRGAALAMLALRASRHRPWRKQPTSGSDRSIALWASKKPREHSHCLGGPAHRSRFLPMAGCDPISSFNIESMAIRENQRFQILLQPSEYKYYYSYVSQNLCKIARCDNPPYLAVP